ncbi:hypothetical protein C1646_661672 [Rhizophagus diaphanus]|nr:hypothetical protein C1646_661672 [Rhizophagus diaphanus] [Rhizophagus sp. MUCL 43196]
MVKDGIPHEVAEKRAMVPGSQQNIKTSRPVETKVVHCTATYGRKSVVSMDSDPRMVTLEGRVIGGAGLKRKISTGTIYISWDERIVKIYGLSGLNRQLEYYSPLCFAHLEELRL